MTSLLAHDKHQLSKVHVKSGTGFHLTLIKYMLVLARVTWARTPASRGRTRSRHVGAHARVTWAHTLASRGRTRLRARPESQARRVKRDAPAPPMGAHGRTPARAR